jgi:hypothetical protein
MKIADVKKLQPGDEVFWNDPDDGKCSRHYTISKIEVRQTVQTVIIEDVDGDTLECFASELS